jgi:phosphoribosylformimino-5-aminoimidazole carboxamide ribonucleotide (ProFAR) isomerase
MTARNLPTLRVDHGALVRTGRWDHSRALLDGTIAEVAPRLRRHGFDAAHVRFLDGITDQNRAVLATLAGHFELLIVEGAIRDAATCGRLLAEGVRTIIVDPAAIEDPAMEPWLEAGNPPPLMAVGNFLDPGPRALARRALERSWSGLVLDALVAEETRLIQQAVQKWGAELVVRLPHRDNAGEQFAMLEAFLPLDAPLLIDVEFLIEMTRARFELVHEVYPPRT